MERHGSCELHTPHQLDGGRQHAVSAPAKGRLPVIANAQNAVMRSGYASERHSWRDRHGYLPP